MNHLEQLVWEWLEYNGYFVKRNIKVGKRKKGGYDGEVDVVGFDPRTKQLVHFECSTDTQSWAKRVERFTKKFESGRKFIPELFSLKSESPVKQIALFVYGSDRNKTEIGGGEVLILKDFMKEITDCLKEKNLNSEIVPEQYPLLRTLHLVCEYRGILFQHC